MDLPPILIVAAALAAGVWGVLLALRAPLLHACLAALLAVSCFGASFGTFGAGPFHLSADRLLLASLPPFFVLKRLLTPQRRLQLDSMDLVLVGFLGLLLVSVVTHDMPPKSEATPTPSFLLIFSFVMPSIVYWVTHWRTPGERDSRVVCGFFTLFGIYLAFTAACEQFRVTALVFPRYILDPRELYVGRSVGPFGSSPVLGTWLTISAVAVVILHRHLRAGRLLLAGLLPLLAVGEYLTRTRSGWLGFLLAVPLALVLTGGWLQRRIVLVLGLAACCVAGAWLGKDLISPQRAEGQAVVAYSQNQRLALLQRSAALFVRRPLTGWGFRQFEYASRTQGGGGPLRLVSAEAAEGLASHNTLLRIIVETGLVGTTCVLVLFGMWCRRGLRAIRSLERGSAGHDLATLFLCGFVAYWCEAMFHDVTFMPHENLLIWFLAGCLPAMGAAATAEASEPVPVRTLPLAPAWQFQNSV